MACSLLKVDLRSLIEGERVQVDGVLPPIEESYASLSYSVAMTKQGRFLHLSIALFGRVSSGCRICNSQVWKNIEQHEEETIEWKKSSPKVDLQPLIESLFLLEMEPLLECSGGNCPHRKQIELKKATQVHTPLSQLVELLE